MSDPVKTGGVWHTYGEKTDHRPGRAEKTTRHEQAKDTTEYTIAPADQGVPGKRDRRKTHRGCWPSRGPSWWDDGATGAGALSASGAGGATAGVSERVPARLAAAVHEGDKRASEV